MQNKKTHLPLYLRAILISFLLVMHLGCDSNNNDTVGSEPEEAVSYTNIEEQLIKVEANPEKGFHWAYYLFIPDLSVPVDSQLYLLVSPNNTGKDDKDIQVHDEAAKIDASDASGSWKNAIARELEVPLLVPVFPREDGEYYTHMLFRNVLLIKDGSLKRIDLQLVAMIEDARKILHGKGLTIEEKILMNGFSASGQFSNRFAIIHPYLVRAVASGGLVGVPIIPASEWKGKFLSYPVGIADLEEITGIQFDIEQYREVAQYIYLGSLDDHDEFDIWADDYLGGDRQLIWDITSRDYLERFVISQQIYQELNIPAEFIIYEGVEHNITSEMFDDVVAFFKKFTDE